MKYARIIAGQAVDVVQVEDAEDLAGRFHPSLLSEFSIVPDDVQDGWSIDNDVWSAPVAQPEAEPVYEPIQLAIVDMLRLFTNDQIAGFNALKKVCQALAPADYAAAANGDPYKAALVGFEVGLTHYDALRAGMIELNHPQTVQWLSLLVPLQVLTPDELARVLRNEPPAP